MCIGILNIGSLIYYNLKMCPDLRSLHERSYGVQSTQSRREEILKHQVPEPQRLISTSVWNPHLGPLASKCINNTSTSSISLFLRFIFTSPEQNPEFMYMHTQKQYALCTPSIYRRPVIVFLCFHIEPFCGGLTCSFSSVGLSQLSVEALWQTSAVSSSVQAFQGITRAAWTAPGEFNSQLALVCNPPTLLLSVYALLTFFFFFVLALSSLSLSLCLIFTSLKTKPGKNFLHSWTSWVAKRLGHLFQKYIVCRDKFWIFTNWMTANTVHTQKQYYLSFVWFRFTGSL